MIPGGLQSSVKTIRSEQFVKNLHLIMIVIHVAITINIITCMNAKSHFWGTSTSYPGLSL